MLHALQIFKSSNEGYRAKVTEPVELRGTNHRIIENLI